MTVKTKTKRVCVTPLTSKAKTRFITYMDQLNYYDLENILSKCVSGEIDMHEPIEVTNKLKNQKIYRLFNYDNFFRIFLMVWNFFFSYF